MEYRFGDCQLDVGRRELMRAAKPIPIGPQVFDLLVYLVENRARVVSKDDLLKGVWGGRIVSNRPSRSSHQCGAQGDRRQRRRTTLDPNCLPQGRPLCRNRPRKQAVGTASKLSGE